jgi:hypothetical protein
MLYELWLWEWLFTLCEITISFAGALVIAYYTNFAAAANYPTGQVAPSNTIVYLYRTNPANKKSIPLDSTDIGANGQIVGTILYVSA